MFLATAMQLRWLCLDWGRTIACQYCQVGFVVDKVAMGQVFLPVLQLSPFSTIPPTHHTHSFTYHPHYIMFLSQYFSFPLSVPFPCQYRSPVSTIPLSVPFPCQYHSPVSTIPPSLCTHIRVILTPCNISN